MVEVLMVISIIAILVTIMVPQYSSYQRRTFNSAAVADLKNLKTGIEAYKVEFEVYPQDLALF